MSHVSNLLLCFILAKVGWWRVILWKCFSGSLDSKCIRFTTVSLAEMKWRSVQTCPHNISLLILVFPHWCIWLLSKPTCIFTNDEKLGDILVAIGGRCKCKGNHKDSVQESSSDTNFAALPFELCKVLSSYVHSKITQLKFDKLIRDK